MSRRAQLLTQLFHFRKGGVGFGTRFRSAALDHAERLARETVRLIFADIIGYYRKYWSELGPGALVIRMVPNDAIWTDAAELREQRDLADGNGDYDLASAFNDTLSHLDAIDPDLEALICVADADGFRALRVPVDNPTEQVEALLQEAYQQWN